jgi:hypothetical protein
VENLFIFNRKKVFYQNNNSNVWVSIYALGAIYHSGRCYEPDNEETIVNPEVICKLIEVLNAYLGFLMSFMIKLGVQRNLTL